MQKLVIGMSKIELTERKNKKNDLFTPALQRLFRAPLPGQASRGSRAGIEAHTLRPFFRFFLPDYLPKLKMCGIT